MAGFHTHLLTLALCPSQFPAVCSADSVSDGRSGVGEIELSFVVVLQLLVSTQPLCREDLEPAATLSSRSALAPTVAAIYPPASGRWHIYLFSLALSPAHCSLSCSLSLRLFLTLSPSLSLSLSLSCSLFLCPSLTPSLST